MGIDDDEFRGSAPEAVRARLKLVQIAFGLTRTEFAARLGMAPQRIYNWETTQNISPDGIVSILRVFGVSADWLLAGLEHKLDPQVAELVRGARERRRQEEAPTKAPTKARARKAQEPE